MVICGRPRNLITAISRGSKTHAVTPTSPTLPPPPSPILLALSIPMPGSNDGATLVEAEKPHLAAEPPMPKHELDEPSSPENEIAAAAEHPEGLKLALITLALCLAIFLVALDNTIIATAIPKITDDFNSLADVGWYGSAYLLTTAATQLLFGKFYTFLPIKWVFVAAIVVFEVGSAICGGAPNSTALIIGRAIAGLGSAGIFSGGMIIIAHSVPLEKRPMYSGLIGGMYGIASVAGPLMGGVFTDKVSWRWCFYINLPIGGVCLLFLLVFLHIPRKPEPAHAQLSLLQKINHFDPFGTLLFMPAIVCLLLALQWGGSKYPWGNGRIIALFVLFGLLIITFIFIQIRKQEMATVPPRIIKMRSIGFSSFFAFSLNSSFFIIQFYLPIWFQAIKGVSPVKSGIDNIPLVLSLILASIVVGGLVSKIGYYTPFMLAASVVTAIAAGLISTFTTTTGHAEWIGYQVLFGFGQGFGAQQPLIAAQTVLDLKDVPIGTSIILFLQTIGGALFVSVGQNIFTNTLIKNIARNVPAIDPASVLAAGATNLKGVVPAESLGAVLVQYNGAIMTTFRVSIAMSSLSLIGALGTEWRSVKGKHIEMGAGAA
ncbi:unnamed protein product [Mycena citricolor]|uniref:Major facilitator superfamily (MFS) profile domain-containing protein n=1 Tax=Mycena citricolor TaxID=2018698 RepID=A0AAD2Q5L9_9AGAR|nr:unnamed protein product [Mycena citricolor]